MSRTSPRGARFARAGTSPAIAGCHRHGAPAASFHVRSDQGIAVVAFAGDYDLAHARAGIDAALALFPETGADGLLLDVSASHAFTGRSPHQIRMVALYLGLRRKRFASRLAAVAPSDQAITLMRLGNTTATEYGIAAEVVRDHASALAWLRSIG